MVEKNKRTELQGAERAATAEIQQTHLAILRVLTTPERMRPRMATWPVKGHFLSTKCSSRACGNIRAHFYMQNGETACWLNCSLILSPVLPRQPKEAHLARGLEAQAHVLDVAQLAGPNLLAQHALLVLEDGLLLLVGLFVLLQGARKEKAQEENEWRKSERGGEREMGRREPCAKVGMEKGHCEQGLTIYDTALC